MTKPPETALIKDRLRYLRRLHGLTQKRVAEEMGISISRYFSREISNKRPGDKRPNQRIRISTLSATDIEQLITIVYPNLNANWLVTGKGDIWLAQEGRRDASDMEELGIKGRKTMTKHARSQRVQRPSPPTI